jgi:hypothetical protein
MSPFLWSLIKVFRSFGDGPTEKNRGGEAGPSRGSLKGKRPQVIFNQTSIVLSLNNCQIINQ